MSDPYSGYLQGPTSPANHAFAITPHDTNDLSYTTRALHIGTQGNIKVDMAGGETAVTFTAVSGILQIRVTRVYDADTTASNIVGLY